MWWKNIWLFYLILFKYLMCLWSFLVFEHWVHFFLCIKFFEFFFFFSILSVNFSLGHFFLFFLLVENWGSIVKISPFVNKGFSYSWCTYLVLLDNSFGISSTSFWKMLNVFEKTCLFYKKINWEVFFIILNIFQIFFIFYYYFSIFLFFLCIPFLAFPNCFIFIPTFGLFFLLINIIFLLCVFFNDSLICHLEWLVIIVHEIKT